MTMRGDSRLSTSSSRECVPTTCVPFAGPSKNSSTVLVVRLKTATLKPWSFMLRTRFCPITARPIRPISHTASDIRSPKDEFYHCEWMDFSRLYRSGLTSRGGSEVQGEQSCGGIKGAVVGFG